jgi:cytochrome c oxidase subunit 3
MELSKGRYFVPHETRWPIVCTVGLFTLLLGASLWLNQAALGPAVAVLGGIVMVTMIFGWFATVIEEASAVCITRRSIVRSVGA